MKILDLPLKAQWYNMIESGEKREQYRERKQYWDRRLQKMIVPLNATILNNDRCTHNKNGEYVHYDAIRFRYGYTKRTMLFKLKDISIGIGNPKWGAPKEEVFILKLGNKIE